MNQTSYRIKEVCRIIHGGTPSKENSSFWNGSIPWVSPKDMKVQFIGDAQDHVTEAAVRAGYTYVVPIDTIFVVTRSGVLKHTLPVALTVAPMAFNQDIRAFLPETELIYPSYLLWLLKALEPEIIQNGIKVGPTVHSLKSGFLENLEIYLPRLDEQQRIAKQLRAQFAAIEEARATAKAQLAGINQLPAAYLREAFSST